MVARSKGGAIKLLMIPGTPHAMVKMQLPVGKKNKTGFENA
jgi:hypothetical protein